MVDVDKENVLIFGTKGSAIRAKTVNQIRLVEAVNKNDVVFALGPAGTGKTYVSVALAVKALKNKKYEKSLSRVLLLKPVKTSGSYLAT